MENGSLGYEHVHEKFRHIVSLSDEERLLFINEPRFIPYPSANEMIETLKNLLNMPKQHRMPNLMIIGDSNNGKTTIIQQFLKKHGETYIDENEELNIPVVSIQSPSTANEKALYIEILESMVLPHKATQPAVVLQKQVIHALRNVHAKMLIIDEIHSLLAGTAIKQRELMNVIKYMCNELMIPIVLVGTMDAVRVLHTDPQHASRFPIQELAIRKNDKEFMRIVGSFERIYPLKKPSNLTEPTKLNLIYSISEGKIGNIKNLLNACATAAIKSKQEQITLDIIKEHSWLRSTQGIRKKIV